jgi:hypothetical protein
MGPAKDFDIIEQFTSISGFKLRTLSDRLVAGALG